MIQDIMAYFDDLMDEDGDLQEEPFGRWSEEKQKSLKIKK